MENLIIGIVCIGAGLLFMFNNKNISKGASWFYQKFYTEHNLRIAFWICGAILLLAGLALIFLK